MEFYQKLEKFDKGSIIMKLPHVSDEAFDRACDKERAALIAKVIAKGTLGRFVK